MFRAAFLRLSNAHQRPRKSTGCGENGLLELEQYVFGQARDRPRNADLYFTDQGQSGLHDPAGRLYRLRPDGRLDCLLDNVPSPNGVALSPDGNVLYLAVTRGNCVWRVPLMADGSVSKVSQFFTSYGPSGPDGLAVDNEGNLLICNPGLGYVWLLNHRAEPQIVWRSPRGMSTTHLAFGGGDRRSLFCTESVTGTILYARAPHPGLTLAKPDVQGH